jgi:MoxR-like ATPase
MQTQTEFLKLRTHLEQLIIGQKKLLDRLLISLLTGGHILLEGAPGLAKTTAINTLAGGVHAGFQRIQFTPDLMPGDITGIDIFDPEAHQFKFVKGPIFHEIILADEINRAPPKVQSALLEAMAEHQVTVGGVTRQLPDLFVVMATQNPLEQSGTYPLPEAQLDRFLLHIKLDYPTPEEELEILKLDRKLHYGEDKTPLLSPLTPEIVLAARREVADIHVDEMLEKYIVSIVTATRSLGEWQKDWAGFLIAGASPRASIAMLRAASAIAYINGRDHVIPEDILEIAPDILRHRLVLDYSALAAKVTADDIIRHLLSEIPIP